MSNKLPNHVRKRSKNSLQYRRKLQGYKPAEFTRAMACKQDSLESEIQREAIYCTKLYEIELKRRVATSPDVLTEMDTDGAAVELLRKLSRRDNYQYKAGSLYPPEIVKVDRGRHGGIVEEPMSEFLADEIVGLEDLMHETQGRELTVSEEIDLKVMRRAKDALLKKRIRPPRYLSQLFDWYCVNRKDKPDWPTEGREYNRRNNRFLEIMTFIGDCQTEDPDVVRRIDDGLEAYAHFRAENSSVKGQSIKRDMKDSIAAFRRVSKRFKLKWLIEVPEISEQAPSERGVLTDEEQVALVRSCLQANDKIAAILLAQFHAGLMATEVLRLNFDFERSVILDGALPYLLIKEVTKAEDRKRLVPLVIGLDVIRQNLPEALVWLSSVTESAHSHALKKRLVKATGNPRLTAHCLRHTWNSNATAAGIDFMHRVLIGGWNAGGKESAASRESRNYGKASLQRSRNVQALYNSQLKVFDHLLHLEANASAGGNVTSINSRC